MSEETTNNSRKLISGTLATTSVLVALGIAIALNLVVSQTYVRFDLTENKIFTLSEASRKAASSFEEPVEIKVFLSPNMPPPLHTVGEQVSDILSEYKAASAGKLDFQIIEPKDNDQVEETAKGYGCEKVAIGQQSENEVSLRAVYKCIAFLQGEKQEVIRDLRISGNPETDNLEYDFTKALLNLKSTSSRKVGFVAGFGGVAASPQFVNAVKPAFEKLYGKLLEPTSIDLAAKNPVVPSDVSTLILLNPHEKFSPEAKFAIDQFIQRGGSVAWFQSSTGVDEKIRQQLMRQMGPQSRMPDIRKPLDTELNALFKTYGVEHNRDLLLDYANAMTFGYVMTPQGLAQISHPATFQINNIDRAVPFLSRIPPMALPAPASLKISEEARQNSALTIFEALKTDKTARSRTSLPTSMSWKEFETPRADDKEGQYLVAAAIQGKFPSFYEKNPLPEGITEDKLYKGDKKSARLLVVGSGDFFQPSQQLGYDDRLAGIGQQLLFNAIEWLAQDSALAEIRSKSMPRFIGEVDKDTQRRVHFINIIFVPALFVLIGLIMRQRRLYRRRSIKL